MGWFIYPFQSADIARNIIIISAETQNSKTNASSIWHRTDAATQHKPLIISFSLLFVLFLRKPFAGCLPRNTREKRAFTFEWEKKFAAHLFSPIDRSLSISHQLLRGKSENGFDVWLAAVEVLWCTVNNKVSHIWRRQICTFSESCHIGSWRAPIINRVARNAPKNAPFILVQ